MSEADLASDWRSRTLVALTSHYEVARIYTARHQSLGISSLVLSTIVGTAIFGTFNDSPSPLLKTTAGLLSIAAAVLAALQTFFKFAEQAEKSKSIAARYSAINKELEVALTRPSSITQAFLDQARVKLDQVDNDAPSIPQSIREQARKKYRANSTSGTSPTT